MLLARFRTGFRRSEVLAQGVSLMYEPTAARAEPPNAPAAGGLRYG